MPRGVVGVRVPVRESTKRKLSRRRMKVATKRGYVKRDKKFWAK